MPIIAQFLVYVNNVFYKSTISFICFENSVIISKTTGKPSKTKVYKKVKVQAYPALDTIPPTPSQSF